MSDPKYLDRNQALFRDVFEKAHSYEAYLDRSEPKHADRWREAAKHVALTDEQKAFVGTFTRQINWLVLSGVWCGDCVRQGPIFAAIAAAAPTIDLRFTERQEGEEITDLLRINGALKVPVSVLLSEDFFEVQRFGDRTLSTYRAKAQREIGASCSTGLVVGQDDALATETAEWIDIIERVHLVLRTAPMLRERHGD
ncbi:MAG TPA: thiol reductase thioredoxin [Armatimonadetes bacterium]|nr:thiol reductase thioredoxin [Armatimonadota bacterium]